MPRTPAFRKKYMKKDLREMIAGKQKLMGLHDKQLAEAIGMNRLTFARYARGYEGREPEFTFEQLIDLFDVLGFTGKEILKVMQKDRSNDEREVS